MFIRGAKRQDWETDLIVSVERTLVGCKTAQEVEDVLPRIETSDKFTDDFERETARRLADFRVKELHFDSL